MGESGRWLLNGRQKKTEAWWYLARQLTWLPRIHLPPWWLAAHARWAEFWVFVGKRLFVAPLGEFGMGGSHFRGRDKGYFQGDQVSIIINFIMKIPCFLCSQKGVWNVQ